jgi:hypothetical protein
MRRRPDRRVPGGGSRSVTMRTSCPWSSVISNRLQLDHPQPDIRCLALSRSHNRFCVDIREIAGSCLLSQSDGRRFVGSRKSAASTFLSQNGRDLY